MFKTFFIDIDGTLFKHMSADELDAVYLTDHISELLPGIQDYFNSIPPEDYIVITTARPSKYYEYTLRSLLYHGIRYNKILMDLGMGPRILINDTTNPSKIMAIAYNVSRDLGLGHLL